MQIAILGILGCAGCECAPGPELNFLPCAARALRVGRSQHPTHNMRRRAARGGSVGRVPRLGPARPGPAGRVGRAGGPTQFFLRRAARGGSVGRVNRVGIAENRKIGSVGRDDQTT